MTKDESRARGASGSTNGTDAGVKQVTGWSEVTDVLQEHSYCLSVSASSGSGEKTNGISEEQELHDQQSDLIDHQYKQQEQQDEAVADEPVAEVSERSRRVRRIPAKFMPDDKLFDDAAEFPPPVPVTSDQTAVRKKPDVREKQASVRKNSSAEPVCDVDSEDDEDEDEEDDEDEDEYKEYCICRKPHGNRFMIACDNCEDWFHGSCIGVSKKQSEQYESWVCQTCRDNDPTLVPVMKQSPQQNKPLTDRKPVRKSLSQSQSHSSSDSEDEKRPRSTPHRPKAQSMRRKSATVRSKNKDKNGVADEVEKADEKEKQRLREVIEKAKREHAEKVKRRERRQGPVDPTMNQLFQVTESSAPKSPTKTSPTDSSQHHHRIRCVICRKHRVNSDKTIYCSLDCIKHHVRKFKKTKHAELTQGPDSATAADPIPAPTYPVFDAFDANDTLDAQRKKEDVAEKDLLHFIIRNPGYVLDPGVKVTIPVRKPNFERSDSRKSSVSDGGKTPSTPVTPAPPHPLKRKSMTENEQLTPAQSNKQKDHRHDDRTKTEKKGRSEDLHSQAVRERVSKAFLQALEKRLNDADDLQEAEKTRRRNMIPGLVKEIEKSLFLLFQSEGKLVDAGLKNYLAKYRSLTFNFNNSKNRHLLESLFSPKGTDKHISPDEVVRMTPEELARGSDLDAWRKIEAKKSLINSVIVSEETCDGPKLKKTRKGEEEIQTDAATSEEHFSRDTELESGKTNNESLNPLEMILNEIKSSSKSSNRRDDIEHVPKSPVREDTRIASDCMSSPPDLPVTPEKRKRSLTVSDEESKSLRTGVKRVKITPEINSILSTTISDATADAFANTLTNAIGREWSERKVLWEGFCSGFEDSTASSSFNPAMNSGSRFPVVCRTLVTGAEAEMEKLPLALNVVGRIAPEQVASYVQKVVQSTGDQASGGSIVELIPLTLKHKHSHLSPTADFELQDLSCEVDDEDDESLLFRENFNKFINYLIQRKRYAVVDVKSAAKSKKSNVKDVYLLPFSIPVTGEAAATESRSSQLPSKLMADLFDKSPFTREIRHLKNKKPIATLLMLLIKKSAASSSSGSRERSGSSSSSSTTSSRPSLRRSSSHTPREERIPEERSFTPPPPAVTQVTSTPQTKEYVHTAATRAVPVSEPHEEYDPESYIPGLSPDRNSTPQVVARKRNEEEELRQKALIQMRLLHPS